MNNEALSQFLATQPDDAACLAALAEIVPTGKTSVPLGELNYYLHATGLRLKIEAASAAAPTSPAAAALAYITDATQTTFNFADPLAGQLLPALIAQGVIAPAEEDACRLALGITAPRAKFLDISDAPVVQADLDRVRNLSATSALALAFAQFSAHIQNDILNPLAASGDKPPASLADLLKL